MWQEIFEAIGHMALILDKDHRILAANRSALEKVGMSRDEIIGQQCYTIFHQKDQVIDECPLASMLKAGAPKTTEAEVEALGRNFIVSCTPVFDSGG